MKIISILKQKTSPGELLQGKKIALVFSSKISGREKRELKNKIVENGGQVTYSITKYCDLMACDASDITSHKFRSALQYGIPIVALQYLHDSFRQSVLLPYDDYLVTKKIYSSAFQSGKVKLLQSKSDSVKKMKRSTGTSPIPYVSPQSLDGYELLKAIQLTSLKSLKPMQKEKTDVITVSFCVIELHVCKSDDNNKYCVFTHEGTLTGGDLEPNSSALCRYVDSVEEAVNLYSRIYDQMTSLQNQMKQSDALLHPEVGSLSFQSLQMERFELLSSLDPEVSQLVGTLWREAVGHISQFLAMKSKEIRPWMVDEAEGILLQILSIFGKCSKTMLERLSHEFYSVLPHVPEHREPLLERRMVVQKLDLMGVLKDMIAICEATGWAPGSDLEAKYRALHCRVLLVPESSSEFETIASNIVKSQTAANGVLVRKVFGVHRNIERAAFSQDIDNKMMLFHCTAGPNAVGILSHGILPPRLAVTKRGVERTDAGMLGSGIYFTDSISHAIKYSKLGIGGKRYLLVAMIALGNVHEVYEIDPSLEAPPQGYHSVKGVQSATEKPSDFSGNEFVIYNQNQQHLCYLVEFNLPEDNEVSLEDTANDDATLPDDAVSSNLTYNYKLMDIDDRQSHKKESRFSGLKVVSSGETLGVEAIHVRAQIVDTVARVVLFQVYKNPYAEQLEVRFVFPLEFGAAVCGFEAFIGGKHIQGEVKEKETAHKEYKEAIREGHGAYLLDEDEADIFTVHVGNLPANTTAVIKISYIAELSVERDSVKFCLPASVASWQQNASTLQSDASAAKSVGNFSLQASLEMASDIISVNSPSHKINVKKTETKAVVELENDEDWGGTFTMYARLKDPHVPRMWVERHPKRCSEACMLTFYPEFQVEPTQHATEIILMLDASNSMVGDAFQDAIQICIHFLNSLRDASNKSFRFNITAFGSFFKELFPMSKPFTTATMKQAESFLKEISPNMGSTNLRRVLQMYNLLTSSQLNVFVVSDGHINGDEVGVFSSVQKFQPRIFTFATSQTANRHLLRTISSCTGGAFESFDRAETRSWDEKVMRQIERAQQPALTKISVEWQQFDKVHDVVQSPQKIRSLFNGDCLVIYGLVSNCTVATLKASFQGQEVSTVVATSELNKTSGITIHSLAARGIVRDWEDGPLDEDMAIHWLKKRTSRYLAIQLAKEHSLVTSLTSFLAVEKRQEHESVDEEPPIAELVEAASVDILPYMDFFHLEAFPYKGTTGKLILQADVRPLQPYDKIELNSRVSFLTSEVSPLHAAGMWEDSEFPSLNSVKSLRERPQKKKKLLKKSYDGPPLPKAAPEPPPPIPPPICAPTSVLAHQRPLALLEHIWDIVPTLVEPPPPPPPPVSTFAYSAPTSGSAFGTQSGRFGRVPTPAMTQSQPSALTSFALPTTARSQAQPPGPTSGFAGLFGRAATQAMAQSQPPAPTSGFKFGVPATAMTQSLPPAPSSGFTFGVATPAITQAQPPAPTSSFTPSAIQSFLRNSSMPGTMTGGGFGQEPPHSQIEDNSSLDSLTGDALETIPCGIPQQDPQLKSANSAAMYLEISDYVGEVEDEDMGMGLFDSNDSSQETNVDRLRARKRTSKLQVDDLMDESRSLQSEDDFEPVLTNFRSYMLYDVTEQAACPPHSSDGSFILDGGEESGLLDDPIAFVQSILSWKGGGLPVCSAIFAKMKTIKNLSLLSSSSTSSIFKSPESLVENVRDAIMKNLKECGLDSLGQIISAQIFDLVLTLASLYMFLLGELLPRAFEFENANDPDAVFERASKILVANCHDDWVEMLTKVHEINNKYPLLYSNLELGKSWEDFLMKKIFCKYF